MLTWQLSKLPVTARLCTFLSRTVVICNSCMGLTRPLGCSMKTETSFFPRSPYMAADPVSPLVAPTTVRWYLSTSHSQNKRSRGVFPQPGMRMLERTSAGLSLVSPDQEVLEEVAEELERNIFEGERGTVEQLEQVQVILERH